VSSGNSDDPFHVITALCSIEHHACHILATHRHSRSLSLLRFNPHHVTPGERPMLNRGALSTVQSRSLSVTCFSIARWSWAWWRRKVRLINRANHPILESKSDEETITSRRTPVQCMASIVARTPSAKTEVAPSPRVPSAESTISLPGSTATRSFACMGFPTTTCRDFALPPKAERPKVVISWPRAKPCATSALPVLPVAPKTNNRIDANYTLPGRDRNVFEKLDIIPQRGVAIVPYCSILSTNRVCFPPLSALREATSRKIKLFYASMNS
jgi:hypothetical protein